jgi:hypothetical protein
MPNRSEHALHQVSAVAEYLAPTASSTTQGASRGRSRNAEPLSRPHPRRTYRVLRQDHGQPHPSPPTGDSLPITLTVKLRRHCARRATPPASGEGDRTTDRRRAVNAPPPVSGWFGIRIPRRSPPYCCYVGLQRCGCRYATATSSLPKAEMLRVGAIASCGQAVGRLGTVSHIVPESSTPLTVRA